MNDREINRVIRQDQLARGVPSVQPLALQRTKLRRRYRGRLVAEIRRTQRKLRILIELRTEEEQQIIAHGFPGERRADATAVL